MAIESTGEDKEETLGMPSPLILRAAFPANDSLDIPLNTTFAISLLSNVKLPRPQRLRNTRSLLPAAVDAIAMFTLSNSPYCVSGIIIDRPFAPTVPSSDDG